ncbi:MAG: hypothetical protein P8176_16245, partial [Gammaproteobacteria bacterium]
TTTPTPPLEPTDGSVVTGCTAPGFLPCFYYDVTVRSDESLISISAQDFDRWRFTLGMRYNFQ